MVKVTGVLVYRPLVVQARSGGGRQGLRRRLQKECAECGQEGEEGRRKGGTDGCQDGGEGLKKVGEGRRKGGKKLAKMAERAAQRKQMTTPLRR